MPDITEHVDEKTNNNKELANSENPFEKKTQKFDLDTIALFLRLLGVRKSVSAIVAAGGVRASEFSLTNAVAAMQHFKLKCSTGILPLGSWEDHWMPLLALMNDGSILIVTKFVHNEAVITYSPTSKDKTIRINWNDFYNSFSGYAVVARKMSDLEARSKSGHWFFSAFKSSKWLYFQVALAAIVSNFLALTTSIFTMTVYDRVIPNAAMESLYALSVGVAFALGFDFIIKMLRALFIDIASKKVDLVVSRRLFNRILNFSSIEQQQKSGAMSGVVREFETLREFFTSSTLVILVDLPFVLFFVYVINLIAGPLAYVPLITVPIVLLVGLSVQPFMAKAAQGGLESGVNKQAILVETMNGLETIKANGSGPLMRDRYQSAVSMQANTGAKSKSLSQFIVNFSASLQQFAQIAIIFFGVFLIRDGVITQGALIAAVILGGRAMAPLGQLANVLSRANNALTAYRSLSKLFKTEANGTDSIYSISREVLDGDIEFKNVTFSYSSDAQPILENISVKIEKHQKVALVGKMGSGKSTFLKLLSGAIEPSHGGVLIDGIDVRQIDPADRVKNVGVMPQEPWLFSGTIRENIQLGFNEYPDERIIEVAGISTADNYISLLPEGFDFELKEKGVGLSGGQKQTLCLARCLLHDPSIILLDEPTSALDQGSEQQVVKNLSAKLHHKTAIIVTHRNAILSICDRVLVFENGQIIADGPPENFGVKKPNAKA